MYIKICIKSAFQGYRQLLLTTFLAPSFLLLVVKELMLVKVMVGFSQAEANPGEANLNLLPLNLVPGLA